MAGREVTILGTSSQLPTRFRNHNGAFLRWDRLGFIFDPGEGTQRQMTHFGVKASQIQHIALTHFHGDHCLGVPGLIQRMVGDGVSHDVHAWFPDSGAQYFKRLRYSSIYDEGHLSLEEHPLPVAPGVAWETSEVTLTVRPLDHRVDAIGYRLQEKDGVRMLSDELAKRGIRGPDVAALMREGRVVAPGGQAVALEEVSVPRPGQSMAFIMDTRLCDSAIELARGVDLLITESTFLESERKEAQRYAHMTARDAAVLAREADARLLLLTHFSQRYPDNQAFADEASAVFSNVVAAEDGLTIEVPPRRT